MPPVACRALRSISYVARPHRLHRACCPLHVLSQDGALARAKEKHAAAEERLGRATAKESAHAREKEEMTATIAGLTCDACLARTASRSSNHGLRVLGRPA